MQVAGASHVSFTVSDVARSLEWYRTILGAEVMMEEHSDERTGVVLTLPGTELLVGLNQHGTRRAERFDPQQIGLDHFAFSVGSRDDLDRWESHFERHGVDSSGPVEVPPGAILNFKDPDGIALALFWRR